jgi:hypothetical protein
MNIHAQTEDKIDELNVCLVNSLNTIWKFFSAKVGKEEIFKLIIKNESLHKISNDIGVKVVSFATSKNHTVKSMMFPQCNIYKYTYCYENLCLQVWKDVH